MYETSKRKAPGWFMIVAMVAKAKAKKWTD